VPVDELRHDFLTGAALAGDHHRGVGLGDATGQLHCASKPRRGAQQRHLVAVAGIADSLPAQVARLARHQDDVRRAADQNVEVRGREWLGEIVPGPGTKRLDARRDTRIPGDDDDDHFLVGFQGASHDLHAADRRHV